MASPASRTWPEAIFYGLQLWYGCVLFVWFVVAVAFKSVSDSCRPTQPIQPVVTGPCGRRLPATRRGSRDDGALTVMPAPQISKAAKCTYRIGSAIFVTTFIANFVSVVLHTVSETRTSENQLEWSCGEETSVYYVSGLFMHLYVLVYLSEADMSPNRPVVVTWAVTLSFELFIFMANTIRLTGCHQVPRSVSDDRTIVCRPDKWDYVDISLGGLRLLVLLFLLLCTSIEYSRRIVREKLEYDNPEPLHERADEGTPLLLNGGADGAAYDTVGGKPKHGAVWGSGVDVQNDSASGSRRHYANGVTNSSATGSFKGRLNGAAHGPDVTPAEETGFYRPRKLPHKSWREYMTGYSSFFPYLWPRDSFWLQMVVFVCFIILVSQRIFNFLVPNLIGRITDAFTAGTGTPWVEILMLSCCINLASLLSSVRERLWIPVSQYSYLALATTAFEHVHSLSLDFHLEKRTGEILSALNKGGAINSFLEKITFEAVPRLADLAVAVLYFLLTFGALYATIAAVITVFSLHMTIKMASTRADLRRDMVNADREEEAVKNDSITSYETVKYFNADAYESTRYQETVQRFQAAEAKYARSMGDMNIYQTLVFMCGVLIMLVVAAVDVARGTKSVGGFLVILTYLYRLQEPLQFFSSFYRTIQQALISGERLLELFKIQPTVVDRLGAEPLLNCDGHIRWTNVQFSYRTRPALRDISLVCLPGTTTAFVGESGGGKSTILRLMFRYYNCDSGTIAIDGQDVKDLTIDSVRRHIGVVPQDPVLFNETIMFNLKYGNPDVSDEEVYEACRAASIHDRILTFARGYDTKVGDRGTLLSGGEKQRVAIAHTILKKPKIVMLDEATSALDSKTEQQIQKKLIRGGSLGQGRTLLIVAHRLSTIAHADQILVLHAGSIVEKGTHDELLAMNGRYASMWLSQSQQAPIVARSGFSDGDHQ